MDVFAANNTSGDRGSFIRDSVFPYLGLHPVGVRNALRLYGGYCAALVVRLLPSGPGKPVGAAIPGKELLLVSFRNIKAMVRPGTNDLDLLIHHEPKTLSWFRPNNDDVVVDVGAHIGRYTLVAARAGARVYSFEPDPSNFQLLEANVRLNRYDRVSAHRVALSNASGVRSLKLSSGTNRGTSSLLPPVGLSAALTSDSAPVTVRCMTLDEFTEAEDIREIDWLKIDVEGHECEVLEGADRSIRHTRNLILEVASGNERPCRTRLEQARFKLEAVEPGFPTSNWLLVRT